MKSRTWIVIGVVIVAGLILQQFWHWEVDRIEVPPGKFLVRVHLWGKDLPPDEIIAPDDSHKGILLDVLPEGRHFWNPLIWKTEVHPVVEVPKGKCMVLTRKFGKQIPADRLREGDFLARDGERGIIAKVEGPSLQRINPHAYAYELVDAVEVTTDQVGVRTLKVGLDPQTLKPGERKGHYVVPEGYRGVQATPVSSGTYYINPYVESITPVDVRSHRVEFSDIEFPSKDGFILKPYVLVTYRVAPDKAPDLFVMLAEAGQLHQQDANTGDLAKNQILQKLVLPLIRGYVRIEGSKFDARDFITLTASSKPDADGHVTNPRERLQQDITEKIVARCKNVGIVIESITLAQMDAPVDLARQIAERELARVEREKNADRIGQYKTEQELKATEALKQQEQDKVDAQTRLIQARTEAQRRMDTEEAKLKQDLENAKVKLDAAKNKAKEIIAIGKAEADVINLQNEAEVSGLRKAVQGFPSPDAFAQYHVINKLGPAISEIFASDGSDFAKLIAAYLAPVSKKENSATDGIRRASGTGNGSDK